MQSRRVEMVSAIRRLIDSDDSKALEERKSNSPRRQPWESFPNTKGSPGRGDTTRDSSRP